jgi:hypothetical protein
VIPAHHRTRVQRAIVDLAIYGTLLLLLLLLAALVTWIWTLVL